MDKTKGSSLYGVDIRADNRFFFEMSFDTTLGIKGFEDDTS